MPPATRSPPEFSVTFSGEATGRHSLLSLIKQAKVPGQGGGKEQPGIGHQAVVVEGDVDAIRVDCVAASCILTLARDNSSYVAVRSAADR